MGFFPYQKERNLAKIMFFNNRIFELLEGCGIQMRQCFDRATDILADKKFHRFERNRGGLVGIGARI